MKINYLLIASSLLFTSYVQAHDHQGCTAEDLNGDYVMYQNAVNTNQHTGHCAVNIKNGVALSTCKFSSGFNGPVNGSASIYTNCSATMELSFSPAPGVTVSSTFDLQLTPDKQSFIGQWSNTFGVVGTTNGVRFSPSLPATLATSKHKSH